MPFTKPSRRRHLRHRVVLQDVVKKNHHRVKDDTTDEQSRKKVERKRDSLSVSSGSTKASMKRQKKEKEASLVSVLSKKLSLQSSKKSSKKCSSQRKPSQQPPQASVHIQRFQSFLKWYMPYASNTNWRDAQGCFSSVSESSKVVALYSFQVSKESYRLGVTLHDDGQQQQRAYIDVHCKTGSIVHKCGNSNVYNHLLLLQRHAQQTAVFRDEASFHRARQGNLVPNLHNVLCILEGSASWMCS